MNTNQQIMLDHGLTNVDIIEASAQAVGINLPPACALMTMESSGRNVYGHDKGAMLSGFPADVTKDNFQAYWYMVNVMGATPNGVGPCQITSPGLIKIMLDHGQKPWDPRDNMEFGFSLILGYRQSLGSWRDAAIRYNGSTTYADRFVAALNDWRAWLP